LAAVAVAPLPDARVAAERFAAVAAEAERLLALSVGDLAVGKLQVWKPFSGPLHRSDGLVVGAGAVVGVRSWGKVVPVEAACRVEVPA
jgi:hypothetical protein